MHKVQGLTVEKVVISFDLVKQQSFNYGQMYVALSRVASLDNLYLIGSFTLSAIKQTQEQFMSTRSSKMKDNCQP